MLLKTIGLKEASLEKYEKAGSYYDKTNEVGGSNGFNSNSPSLRPVDTHGSSTMSNDFLPSKAILGNKKTPLDRITFS